MARPKKTKDNLMVTEKITAFRDDLVDPNKRLIFAVGLPSTGKTRSAIECAIEQVKESRYEKLIICRPVLVPAYGLLPGSNDDKMHPYIRQSLIYISKSVQINLDDKLEVIPVDQLQGNRFFNAIVVFDEMQNIPKDETFKIMSRVGENSKFIFLGDISKGQEHKKIKNDSFLHYAVEKFREKPYASIHEFYDTDDILGDDITKDIIITLMGDFV